MKIGIVGKIIEGNPLGWYFIIQEEELGSYLILISKDSSISKFAEGYDYWAEDYNTLKEMFNEFNWKVKWMDAKK